MNAAHVSLATSAVVLALVACSRGTLTTEATSDTGAALAFASGNNDGYCASNPSANCFAGTPVPAKTLVLTFDDGPGSQTSALSSWLKSQGIRATFFMNGKNLPAAPGTLLSQLVADGHLIGNHTQDHLDLTTLSDSAIEQQVTTTDTAIAPYVADNHFLFRAPFGAWDANDYAVLHASAMNKYSGPVKWDVGGSMSSRYAADWDCWQDTDGYGVQTTKQCGDRYLQEIADIGRGIILMHDADYGDASNHDPTSGQGNTVDMVKYLVPLLKQQGYSFLRADEVPDIAATFPHASGADAGGACAVDPTWAQTTYANDWWIEYEIGGTIASASLEVVNGATTTLANSYGKWTGSPATAIPAGTQVVVHATTSAGATARTKPFAYLVETRPLTECGAAPVDAGADSGSCTSTLHPAWSQGAGANNWWVEYAPTPNTNIASVSLEIVGGATVALSAQYQKWTAGVDTPIATGASVVLHVTDKQGNTAQTSPFGYLTVKSPVTEACTK